jgi:hypothetical protein
MRHILRAVDTKRTQHCNQTSLTPASEYSAYEGGLVSNSNAFTAASSESHKAGANLLPPDEVMQRLTRAYFDNTGLLFPYIHEQEFLDTYERFRASGFRGNVRRTWLGLLNMILAMATCTSCWEDSGSESHFEESDVYYRRAQELCQTQMFRGTTLETGREPPSNALHLGTNKLQSNISYLRANIFRARISLFIHGPFMVLLSKLPCPLDFTQETLRPSLLLSNKKYENAHGMAAFCLIGQ